MSSLFNFLTYPLGLPIDTFYSYLIMLVIGEIAYSIAYSSVGNLYTKNIIQDSFNGSICHWLIRFPVYIIIWAVLYGLISLGKLIYRNWKIVLLISSCAVATIIILAITALVKRKIRKRKAEQH